MTAPPPPAPTPAAWRRCTWAAAAACATAAVTLLVLLRIAPADPRHAVQLWHYVVTAALWLVAAFAAAGLLVLLVHPATPVHLARLLALLHARYRMHQADYVEAMMRVQKAPTAADLAQMARMLQDADHHVDAIQALVAARELDPRAPEIRYRLARSLLRLRRPAAAADELAVVLGLDPEHDGGRARLLMAEAALALGQPEPALQLALACEARNPPGPESAFLRGRCLLALGRTAEATAAFAQATAPGPAPRTHAARLAAARARWRLWTTRAKRP